MTRTIRLLRFSVEKKSNLVGLLLLGLALRCIGLPSRGIQYDDAFSICLSTQNWDKKNSGTPADTIPPLCYLILHLWMHFRKSIGWLRLISIIFSIVVWESIRVREPGLSILWWICFLPAILFLLSYLIQPVFVVRGFLSSTLVFLGVAAAAAHKTPNTIGRTMIILQMLAGAAIGISNQVRYSEFPHSPYPGISTKSALKELEIHYDIKGQYLVGDLKVY